MNSHSSVLAAAVLAALGLALSMAHAQPIYRCTTGGGQSTLQDTPCTGTEKQTTIITSERASANSTEERQARQLDELRAAVAACTPRDSARCTDLAKRVTAIDQLRASTQNTQEMARELRLEIDADIVSTRLNHRIAKQDYERLDAQIKQSYGSDSFNQLLTQRSDASRRMSAARIRYYTLTRTWLD